MSVETTATRQDRLDATEALARFVGSRTGLAFAASRREDVEAGIRRAMARAEVREPGRYLALLERGDVTIDDLVDELTVGETYFFREPAQMGFVKREALPEILRRRGTAHAPRVWSAGCASGEEPYSLAILLDELGLAGRARVLGTDVARAALARARDAVYGRWSLRAVPDSVVAGYFRPTAGGLHALDARIRAMVSIGYLNLALDGYPSIASGAFEMDLILCRNVLIYFDRAAVARVARRLFASLAPGGWLVAGPSDPPLAEHAPFETVVTTDGVFYRRADAAALRAPAPPPLRAATITERARPTDVADHVPDGPAARPEPSPSRAPSPLDQARDALASGEYDRALGLVEGHADPEAAVIAVRARANRDGAGVATELAAELARRHALSPELHFLHATLLLELGRADEAARALRRVLYLDRTLPMAHYVLGMLLLRRGERAAARRAYAAAAELAGARPPDEQLPLGDGERAGRLARAAHAEAERLEAERAP